MLGEQEELLIDRLRPTLKNLIFLTFPIGFS
jgi:hypothetical protein